MLIFYERLTKDLHYAICTGISKMICLSCFFLSAISFHLQAQYKIWNPANDTLNVLAGKGWNEQGENFYRRLPAKSKQTVREDVWNVSGNTSGLTLRFTTDANQVIVKYQTGDVMQFHHMPATGVSGVDLYLKTKEGNWLWAAGKYSFKDTIIYTFTTTSAAAKKCEYTLYLPLYNELKWLTISVPQESFFRPIPVSNKKPIVVYGTSIAQGACATRPGLAWTSILERKLNIPVYNLGFSGNGRLEQPVVELISEINASLYVIDCLPNMVPEIMTAAEVKQRIVDGISILQKNKPGIPVLFCEHDGYIGGDVNVADEKKYQDVNKVLITTFDSLKKAGVKNIYLLTKSEIGQNIESMVDGVHPNDIGMMLYANAYFKKITQILRSREVK